MRKLTSKPTAAPLSRNAQLASILSSLRNAETGQIAPRQVEAGVFSAAAFLLLNTLCQGVYAVLPSARGYGLGLIIPLVVALGVFLYRWENGSWARSWTDDLTSKLVKYDPADRAAYRELQGQVSQAGRLSPSMARQFVDAETETLARATVKAQANSPVQQLVNRDV